MKNICASVDAVSTQKKKEGRKKKEVEEEYTWKTNETVLYLKGNPDCFIVVGGEWHGNKANGVVGSVDMYFRHILTGERCETAWAACIGWSDQDERTEEIWETLCMRIQSTDGLEQIICDEESFGM